MHPRVAYYYDPDVGAFTYGLGHPMKPHRIHITHDLVAAYNLLPKMQVLRPLRATPHAMTAFHTDEYVLFLQRVTPETMEDLTAHGTRFLIMGEDNPAFDGVFDFCSISAGGSISAAQRIASGAADIAINWAGGLHHAKKREASGFCYINDIVLGILELLRTYPRVLYVDIDCHHGDGVEEAFYTTDRVMTCSFHKFGEYFPGTGTQEDRGRGKGKNYALNVPLKNGITDEAFRSIFEPVITKIFEVFRPSVVVLQCGADSLAGDKLGCFNLTMHGHASCVQFLRSFAPHTPLILLGGGGYTVKNVARTWTYETACALGVEEQISRDLPWNAYFEWFGPRYRLEVLEGNMEDLNVRDGSLEKVKIAALQQLSEIAGPPSVAIHDVPSESVAQHLGFRNVPQNSRSQRMEEDERDELDEKLAQHARLVYKLQESMSSSTSIASSASSSSDRPLHSSHSRPRRRRRRHPEDMDSYLSDHSGSEGEEAHGRYEDWDSDGSGAGISRRRARRSHAPKKRMSIVTNRYHEVRKGLPGGDADENDHVYGYGSPAHTRATRRRFFHVPSASGASASSGPGRWDESVRWVLANRGIAADNAGSGSALGWDMPHAGVGFGAVPGFGAVSQSGPTSSSGRRAVRSVRGGFGRVGRTGRGRMEEEGDDDDDDEGEGEGD